MDYVLSGGSSALLDSLDFTLKPQANYVQARYSCTAYPTGASSFAHDTVRTARFQLTSGQGNFLDPETLRVAFTIVNRSGTGTDLLKPQDGPSGFFSQIRVIVGSVEAENITYYNRVHSLLRTKLMPPDWGINEAVEGCANVGADAGYQLAEGYVMGGDSVTVMMKPLLGILNCGKYFPVQHAPVTIEITLAPAAEAINTQWIPEAGFNIGANYELQNMRILYDSVLLDSSLSNSYTDLLLKNQSLTIPYSTYHTTYNSIVPGSTSVALSIVRACTRLKGVFITFGLERLPFIDYFAHPSGRNWWGPNGMGGDKMKDPPLTCQIQVGAMTWPIQPISSMAEFFEHLRKVCGCHDQSVKTLAITKTSYESGSFAIGMSMERVPGANAHSGYNTRSGDLVRIQLNGMAPLADIDHVDKAFITLWADQVLTISEQGCQVFD